MSSGVVVALVVGSAIAVQVAIVGRASRALHPLVISLALQLSGLLVGFGWVLWSSSWSQLPQVIGQWWWLPAQLLIHMQARRWASSEGSYGCSGNRTDVGMPQVLPSEDRSPGT